MQKSFFGSFDLLYLFVFFIVLIMGVIFIQPRTVQAFCAANIVDPFQLFHSCDKDKKKKAKPAVKTTTVPTSSATQTGGKLVSGYCYPERTYVETGKTVVWQVVTKDTNGISVGGSNSKYDFDTDRTYTSYPGYSYEWKGSGNKSTLSNQPLIALFYDSVGKKVMTVKVSNGKSNLNIVCTPVDVSPNISISTNRSQRFPGSVAYAAVPLAPQPIIVQTIPTVAYAAASNFDNGNISSYSSGANYSGNVPNNSQDIAKAMVGISSAKSSNVSRGSSQGAAAIFSLNGVPWIVVLIIVIFVLVGVVAWLAMGKK